MKPYSHKNNIREFSKDINEMVLSGMSSDKILENINRNTYSGQMGKWELQQWKV